MALAVGGTRALDTGALMHLQRTAGNAGVAGLLAQEDREPTVREFLSTSRGQPVEQETRSRMEDAFGNDFSGVRLHRGADAAASAASVQARAYTVGSDVVLAMGVDPGSASGQKTLAHELAHVVQQRSGPVDGTPAPGGVRVSDPADPFEQAAAQAADAVISGARGPATTPGGAAPAASAQRQATPEEEEELQGSFVQRQATPEEEEEEETKSART